MENAVTVKAVTVGAVGVISAFAAWMFNHFGVLFYVVLILAVMMVVDYITGMLASKYEAIDHPDDPAYGWNSKKGAKGIIKKVGYICVIAVAVVVDYILKYVAKDAGIQLDIKAFFGLMVAVWYLLNELLSIIENAGRMGAQVPEWLLKYIAVLKNKIASQNDEKSGE